MVSLNTHNRDNINRLEYESIDTSTGLCYTVWKKTVNNYRFLEEDSFDLALMEESLKRSELIVKEISRKPGMLDGYRTLDMTFALQNGSTLFAKAILRGPHYYLVTVTANHQKDDAISFLRSFHLTRFHYPDVALFSDAALHFTVQTPVIPVLDTFLVNMTAGANDNRFGQTGNRYRNRVKSAFFSNDSTGEAVLVTCTFFPKYYYREDSATFWKGELPLSSYKKFIIRSKEFIRLGNDCSGYKFVFLDTNTVRQITTLFLLKENRMYQVTALQDTVSAQSPFVQTFFNTFRPDGYSNGVSVFTDKQALFFNDYQRGDSLTHNIAVNALSDVQLDCHALPQLHQCIDNATYGDHNYFDTKRKLIRELGFIDNETCADSSLRLLSQLYLLTADTAFFQNEIVLALARLHTGKAYQLLATILTEDPPVFDDENDYNNLFALLRDSLQLTRQVFPALLQLGNIDDYKLPVNNLLETLINSNLINAEDYETYFSRIYFEAKIEMKKMQVNDEKSMEKEHQQQNGNSTLNYRFTFQNTPDTNDEEVRLYSALLMPFYDLKPSVPLYFDKQLRSHNPAMQLAAAVLLLKNNKPLPDSVLQSLSANEKYRALLLDRLEQIHRKDLFPAGAHNQEAMAKSVLLADQTADAFQKLQLIDRQLINTIVGKGYVYFFKYKFKAEDDWKIAISGLQPLNQQEVSSNGKVVKLTGKKLTAKEPVADQLEEQLKKVLFSLHESAYGFFLDTSPGNYHRNRDFDN